MIRKFLLFPILAVCLILFAPQKATAAPVQQGGNLLRNPGFEGTYSSWLPQYSTAQMAPDWTPWWIEDGNHNPIWAQPEYKSASRYVYANRVREGDQAQQYFTFYKSHYAGMYQQVTGVVPGNTYRFSIWAQVWSSVVDDTSSVNPSNPRLHIGIDPTGAAWPGAVSSPPGSVQWGEEVSMSCVIDRWCEITFEAVAQNDVITVYIRSSPDFPIKHNDLYFDSASLVQTSSAPPPPPPGGGGGTGCVIPPSGPWPPCATGGNTPPPNNLPPGCVIPPSGPWPPCATSGNTGGGGTGCVIPPSGPWPPCATGGAPSNLPPGCVIPPSGPWPPCATNGNTGGGGGQPAPPPAGNINFELGGQTHTLEHPNEMKHAGMYWVKFQHKWSNGDSPEVVRGRIEQARANGFKLLLSIPGSDHSNIDYNAYINFLAGVAALGPDAIEVWNEMNIDREWPAGQISAQTYVDQMLKPAYQAIKAANSGVMVISGAPAPTGFFGGCTGAGCDDQYYMQGMAQAGGANYMDCIGVHYNEGILPPSQRSGDPRGNGEYFTRYYWGMVDTYYNAFGGAKPLCFTELGYLSGDGFGGLPAGFAWASNTTVGQQAQWLAEATQLSMNNGKVRMLIIFNVDFTHFSEDPQAGFAMIRPDGSCPACDTLRVVTGGR